MWIAAVVFCLTLATSAFAQPRDVEGRPNCRIVFLEDSSVVTEIKTLDKRTATIADGSTIRFAAIRKVVTNNRNLYQRLRSRSVPVELRGIIYEKGSLEYERERNAPIVFSESHGMFGTDFQFKVGDGTYESIGPQGSNLKLYVEQDTAALRELEHFSAKRSAYAVSVVTFIGGGLLLAIGGTDEDKSERYHNLETGANEYKKTLNAVGVVGLGIALVSGITAAVCYSTADKHMRNAVRIYNDGIDPRKYKALGWHVSPILDPHSTGGGLKLRW